MIYYYYMKSKQTKTQYKRKGICDEQQDKQKKGTRAN